MKKALSLSIFCILFILGCKKSDTPLEKDITDDIRKPETQSIIGGSRVSNIISRPYQVAIFLNGSFRGGGVILSPEWVLTAAHVVRLPNSTTLAPYSSLSIRSGSLNLHNGGTISDINDIRLYPGYDVALVHLSSPLTITQSQSPIAYSINSDPISVNNIVSVSGWGGTACPGDASTFSSETLKQASVRIDNLANPSIITCKSPGPQLQSAYKGDSGGPLVKYIDGVGDCLIGVVSNGRCEDNGITNYMRVSFFADWIYNNTSIGSPRISGSSIICSTNNYLVNNVPAGATVNWSASPSSAFKVSSANNNSATVTKLSEGNGFISAQIGNGGIVAKQIKTNGTPSISATQYPCQGSAQEWYVSVSNDNGINNPQWRVGSSGAPITISSPNSQHTWVYVNNAGSGGGIDVTFTDNCGKIVKSGVTVYNTCY